MKRIISGTGYTDPGDFEHWIKTISPGEWSDKQTFPPNRKKDWTNKQTFPPNKARWKIWRRKT